MNKSIKFLSMAFSIALVSVFISCGDDDDPIIIDEDPVVADGFYILGSASSETPDADLELGAGTVGSGETREGFYSAYIYLTAGTFNYVLYTSNTPTTFGGTAEELPLANNADYSYWRGALTEGGAAITIAEAGLYHVHADLTSDLFFVTLVDYFEIIGSCTPSGWDSGQELAAKAGAGVAGVTFEGTNITLRGPGAYKFRYNSNWDTSISDVEGLNLHSNFGVDGVAGGPDFTFDGEDGVYTVSVTYTPGAGESVSWSLTRTGDAEEITFDPAEYNLGVIGNATAGSWGSDQDLTYKLVGGVHKWMGVVTLLADSAFKVRANDAWTFNLGGTFELGVAGAATRDGSDFASPGTGAYYVEVATEDDGETWTVLVKEGGWGIIGSATTGDDTGWGQDIDLTADGFDGGISTYSITLDLFVGAYKFRANDAWDLNIGGDPLALTLDGSDLSITEAGSYEIVLSSTGTSYSVTATKQ